MKNNEKTEESKYITSAFVIINEEGDILGCHGTGKPKMFGFDFPKGKVEEGETDFDACQRELYEETNLTLEKLREDGLLMFNGLFDCGVHNHNKKKDIHIYLCIVTDFPDISKLKCNSYFTIKDKKTPEMDGYAIIKKSDRYKFNFVLQNKFKLIDKKLRKILKN